MSPSIKRPPSDKHDLAPALRDVLAARVRELMQERPDLNSQPKLSAAAGLNQTTVGRVLRADTGATVDTVEALARAFDVAPLMLLLGSADVQTSSLAMSLSRIPRSHYENITALAYSMREETVSVKGSTQTAHDVTVPSSPIRLSKNLKPTRETAELKRRPRKAR